MSLVQFIRLKFEMHRFLCHTTTTSWMEIDITNSHCMYTLCCVYSDAIISLICLFKCYLHPAHSFECKNWPIFNAHCKLFTRSIFLFCSTLNVHPLFRLPFCGRISSSSFAFYFFLFFCWLCVEFSIRHKNRHPNIALNTEFNWHRIAIK